MARTSAGGSRRAYYRRPPRAFATGPARVSSMAGKRIAQAVAETSRAPGDGLRAEPMGGTDPLRHGRPLIDRQPGSRAGSARFDHRIPQLALSRQRTRRAGGRSSLQPDRFLRPARYRTIRLPARHSDATSGAAAAGYP